jgi:hypothetical protein
MPPPFFSEWENSFFPLLPTISHFSLNLDPSQAENRGFFCLHNDLSALAENDSKKIIAVNEGDGKKTGRKT